MIIDPFELKQRYLQRIAGVRDEKVYIGPEVLTLEITNVCNLRCHYCITDHSPGNPAHYDKARSLPWEKFPGLVADAVDLKVDQITILGTGEPTMHPSFWDMIRLLEHQPIKFVLVTNATFPIERCSDVIRGDHVIINLSTADRQQYMELQGKDLFDRVLANIERLVSLRDTVKPGFHIELYNIVNAANMEQKQKMRELASRLGVNSLHFEKMSEHEYNKDIALPETYMADPGEEDIKTPPARLNGWFNVLITPDGHFNNCYEGPQEHSGHLDQWTLKEFWHSPYMMKMRLLGKKGVIRGMDRQFRLNQPLAFDLSAGKVP